MNLTDLTILSRLPLERPYRVLFGARLASVGREAGGRLVVRFQPDSGVLLTDPGAVRACLLGQPPDDALSEVLRRQQDWLVNFP